MSMQSESSNDTGPKSNDMEMCENCQEAPWRPSTLSAAGSPVNLFRLRVDGKLKPIRDGCGPNTPVWWMSYDPDTSSWKTCPDSTVPEVPRLSLILPRSATMRNGTVFLLPRLVPPTSEKGSSLLPTPSAVNYGTNQGGAAGRVGPIRPSLQTMARQKLWPTPRASDGAGKSSHGRTWSTTDRNLHTVMRELGETETGGQLNPTWVEWLMGYPTGWTDLEDSETPLSHKSSSG